MKIQHGDFFLLPYAGPRRRRLVKAVQFNLTTGHWYVSREDGYTSQVLLSSCHRCPPSVVRRILGRAAQVGGGT